MKRLLPLLLILALTSACQRKKCWSCYGHHFQKEYHPGESGPWRQDADSGYTTTCRKTKEAIRQHEKDMYLYHKDSLSEFGNTLTCTEAP